MVLFTSKEVASILEHYDVSAHALRKWLEEGHVQSSLRMGTGNGARNYFTVLDVVGVAFFKMQLDLGRSRDEAASRIDPGNPECMQEQMKAGRIYFNLTRMVPFPVESSVSLIGGVVMGFSTKPHGERGCPLTCTINLSALEQEIRTIMKHLGIKGVEHGQPETS